MITIAMSLIHITMITTMNNLQVTFTIASPSNRQTKVMKSLKISLLIRITMMKSMTANISAIVGTMDIKIAPTTIVNSRANYSTPLTVPVITTTEVVIKLSIAVVIA